MSVLQVHAQCLEDPAELVSAVNETGQLEPAAQQVSPPGPFPPSAAGKGRAEPGRVDVASSCKIFFTAETSSIVFGTSFAHGDIDRGLPAAVNGTDGEWNTRWRLRVREKVAGSRGAVAVRAGSNGPATSNV